MAAVSFSSLAPQSCREDQRLALIEFNKTLVVNASLAAFNCQFYEAQKAYPRTSSWIMSSDCCSWDGVICDEMTGHVIELNLSCSQLVGNIDSNSSLFQLTYLQRLDLSGNNFSNSQITPNFGRLQSLGLSGDFPLFLDDVELRLAPHDFKLILQNLTQLRELDLRYVNIFSTIPLNFSSHLTNLRLGGTGLNGIIPESIFHQPNLQVLNLEGNNALNGNFPKTKWNSDLSWTYPSFLMLSSCNLSGPIPRSLWNLTNIQYLILENNNLEGSLPPFSSGLQNLFQLSLRNNSLNGELPSWIFSLPSLSALHLSFNRFSGQLKDFKYNTVTEIPLGHNQLQGPLPKSIQNLVNLAWLDIPSNHFTGNVDKINELNFLRSAGQLEQLDLSYNKLASIDQIPFSRLYYIDLRSNILQGSLPIPPPYVQYFLISNNNLSGEIPSSVCNLTSLIVLDLARNSLKGAVPHCLGNMSDQLEVLDAQHNSLSGNLLTTFSFGSALKSFNLHDNKLEGKIPRSLANCSQLEVLDLGKNHLDDAFPMWLGTLANLQVLSLRSNKLQGHVRTSSSSTLFPQLRMVDLSSNAFTAELPTSLFRNLKAMRRTDQTMKAPGDTTQTYYQDSVTVVTKGLELKVVRILSLYTTMDFSNNKFEGHIPSMMGDLIALRVLNLSHNGLQGPIPPSLGKLSVVESLDLSSNKLSGEIPKQLASLTSLAVLNLSRNHLEGCIPKGNQFDTFENKSYEGNDGLRGFPVSGSCGNNRIPETNNKTFVPDEESDSTFLSELSWQAVLMGYGCGLFIGFSISYVMLSSRNPNWLSRIAEHLAYRIIMRRQKKQQGQMHYRRRRRNNGI
ncbi:hypothetical protein P3L10_031536 [Capsicum annuum]